MHRMISASVLGVMVGASAYGGGIDGAWVDPEAGWVAHIDVEGLMGSQIGRAVLEMIGDNDGEKLDAASLIRMLQDGVDDEDLAIAMIREIRDITVIGTDEDEPDLVVARTSGVVHALLEAVKDQEGLRIIERDGHSIVTWIDEEDEDPEAFAVVLPTADRDTYRVIVSHTIDELIGSIAAAQVRRGGPDWINGADGKLAFVHIESPADIAGDDLPAFLQNTGGIEIAFAERDGKMDASLIVETGDADSAQSLVQMAQGLLAFGRMAASDDPELAHMLDLAKGLGLRADGSAVLANLSVDVELLLETARTLIDSSDTDVQIHIDVDTDKAKAE